MKREEEKEKGLNTDNRSENPDIVLFEDNEEEEEEESEEEDESFGQAFGPAAQGRGRGRGMMWPPFMPLARGARPMPGMRGFPPGVMGGDGFSFGGVTPDGFPMPDLFGMASRPFGPYGPRFSGDFAGPGPGMIFPGRPSQPGNFPPGGFGMMMGPGRAPFMGGMGVSPGSQTRPVRPIGTPPMFPPPSSQPSQSSNRTKRDQKASATERNDRFSSGSDQGKGQEFAGSVGGPQEADHLAAGKTFRNDESDSEDEAPRRSRHGEGKKKRRSVEGDSTTNASDPQVS